MWAFVSFCKCITFLFGSAFSIRQDLVKLCTRLEERLKPSNFWEVTPHTQWNTSVRLPLFVTNSFKNPVQKISEKTEK